MELQEMFRQIVESARFKHDQNLMDRKVRICINDGECVTIDQIEVDYKGDIVLHVEHEEDLEEV